MNNDPLEREPIDRMRARLEALLKANAAREKGTQPASSHALADERECVGPIATPAPQFPLAWPRHLAGVFSVELFQ
jgi:hypothetical protein